jgi:Kdo2-lipid IVA lauroyltransferase/acyltransferase
LLWILASVCALANTIFMLLLFRILGRFPLPVLQAVGSFLGALVYLLSGRERRRALENLTLAFPAGVPSGVAWHSAKASGQAVAELPYLWRRPIEEVVGRVVSVEGWEHVEAAQARGEALMFLTPHIGCFEVAGQLCGARLPSFFCLYRPPKNKALAPIMVAGRTRGHMDCVPTDNSGVKKLLKALRQGAAIGMLPDQVPQSGEGIWAPFFARPAYTMTLAARFSALPNVTTLFIYAARQPGGRFRAFVRPPGAPLAGSLEERVGQINSNIEKIVLSQPDQYFWAYNRYKVPHAEAAAELAKEGRQA